MRALPVREQGAPGRVHERRPDVVTGRAGQLPEVAEQRGRGIVPREVVPAAAEDVRGVRSPGWRPAGAATARRARPATCRAAAPRRGRAGSGACARRASGAARARSPRAPPARPARRGPARATCTRWCRRRRTGDLLAAQAGRAAATAVGQADALGLEAGAPRAQEVREFLAPPLVAVGWYLDYQDNPLSSTWIAVSQTWLRDYDFHLKDRAAGGRVPGAVHGHPRRGDRQRGAAVDPMTACTSPTSGSSGS